jgi:hypothetical protein
MHTSSIALAAVALLLTSGAGGPARTGSDGARTDDAGLPWLRDFHADAVADAPSREAEARLGGGVREDEGCGAGAEAGFAIIADMAPAPGPETILASYAAGVVVLDGAGRRLAASPPLECRGSRDTIEGIAAVELLDGEPVIALAATAGGRAERTTWLFFLAPRGEALVPIFAAPVEEHRGEAALTGEVARLPGGAIRYRSPGGAITRWTYDREAGRFVMREVIRQPLAPGPAA